MKNCIALFFLLCFFSCTEQKKDFVPKPKGYNRIDLPQPDYQALADSFPYAFQYSKYAYIRPDSSYFNEPFWIHIIYPKFNAEIQITYKNIQNDPQKYLIEHVGDSHRLTAKHQIKAYAINEAIYETQSGNKAYLFDLEGDVPSQFQFYVTDSTHHFMRGALYFKTALKNDSLKPVIDFIKEDAIHMLNTLYWKK